MVTFAPWVLGVIVAVIVAVVVVLVAWIWPQVVRFGVSFVVTLALGYAVFSAVTFVHARVRDCPVPTEVRVLASYEHLPAAQRQAGDFMAAQADDDPQGCRTVNLTVYALPSSKQAWQALESAWRDTAGPRPDLWLPVSSAEVGLVESNIANGEPPNLELRGHLGSSPLVLGVSSGYRPPDGDLGSLLKVAQDQGLRLARANPNTSATALLHTVGLYEEITDPRRRRQIEQQFSSVGAADARSLLCELRRSPDAGRTAVLTSAALLRAYNSGTPLGGECSRRVRVSPEDRLRVYDPVGGGHLDYPCVVVHWRPESKETDGEERRRELAEDFCEWARGAATADGERQAPSPERLDTTLEAVARARGPAQVLVAVDTSVTMRAPLPVGASRMRAATTGARHLLRRLGALDQVGLWVFSDPKSGDRSSHDGRVEVGPDNTDQVDRGLDELRPVSPWTPINHTVVAGVDRLWELRAAAGETASSSAVRPRQALVVFTDGNQDPRRGRGGAISAATAYDRLTQHHGPGDPVLVFLVVLDGSGPGCERPQLETLAGVPGVDCLDPSYGDLDDVAQKVIAALVGGP